MLNNFIATTNGNTAGLQSTLFAGSFSSASGIGMSGMGGLKRSLSDDGEEESVPEELGGGVKRQRFESLDES